MTLLYSIAVLRNAATESFVWHFVCCVWQQTTRKVLLHYQLCYKEHHQHVACCTNWYSRVTIFVFIHKWPPILTVVTQALCCMPNKLAIASITRSRVIKLGTNKMTIRKNKWSSWWHKHTGLPQNIQIDDILLLQNSIRFSLTCLARDRGYQVGGIPYTISRLIFRSLQNLLYQQTNPTKHWCDIKQTIRTTPYYIARYYDESNIVMGVS